MIKLLIISLLLVGCHENPQTKISHLVDSATLSKKDTMLKAFNKSLKLFDNEEPFQIQSITNIINKHTTDLDTLKCNNWTLNEKEIENIIKNSEPIDGTTWDLSFLVLSCTKSVNVVQNGQHFTVALNAVSFFSVSNGDTTVLFGDFKKSDKKYFLEGPNVE